jgi:hypothetical protein
LRAEIRAGELLIEMRARGERETKGGDRKSKSPGVTLIPKLAEIGVSKMQSSRWQRLAALPPDEREAKIARAKKIAVAATVNDREILAAAKVLRAEINEEHRTKRLQKIAEISKGNTVLPTGVRYPVLHADPAWLFKAYTSDEANHRAPDLPPLITSLIGDRRRNSAIAAL